MILQDVPATPRRLDAVERYQRKVFREARRARKRWCRRWPRRRKPPLNLFGSRVAIVWEEI